MVALTTGQPSRDAAPTTKATSLAYLRFERPDLGAFAAFMASFGLRALDGGTSTRHFRATETT
jgi:hypothetical protein